MVVVVIVIAAAFTVVVVDVWRYAEQNDDALLVYFVKELMMGFTIAQSRARASRLLCVSPKSTGFAEARIASATMTRRDLEKWLYDQRSGWSDGVDNSFS